MYILSKMLFVISISISLQSISAQGHTNSIDADGIVELISQYCGRCTGFFVGPYTLITAFHCIKQIQHLTGKVSDELFIVHPETEELIPVHSIRALDDDNDLAVLHISEYESPFYYELFEGSEEFLFSSESYLFNHENKFPVILEGALSSQYSSETRLRKTLSLSKFYEFKEIAGLSGSPLFLEDGQVIGTLVLYDNKRELYQPEGLATRRRVTHARLIFSDVHYIKELLLEPSLDCQTSDCIQEAVYKSKLRNSRVSNGFKRRKARGR